LKQVKLIVCDPLSRHIKTYRFDFYDCVAGFYSAMISIGD